jgi:hypothetical protein
LKNGKLLGKLDLRFGHEGKVLRSSEAKY